jgi:hypothetical protein
MNNNPVFNISVNGSYPNEIYSITPKTDNAFVNSNPFPDFPNFSGFWTNLGTNLTRSYINFHRNPLVPVIDVFDTNFQNYFYYTNASYITASDTFKVDINSAASTDPNYNRYIERTNVIRFQNNSVITFDIGSLRQDYKTPYEFNFFYFRTAPSTQYPLGNSYGYMLYPNRIFLNPVKLSYNSGSKKWTLVTNVKLLSSSFISISQSSAIENDAYLLHKQRLNSIPLNTIIDISNNLNSNYFTFDIKACRSKNDYHVLSFNGSLPPSYQTALLDSNNDVVHINPDTTFVTFSASFNPVYLSNGTLLSQGLPEQYLQQNQPSANYSVAAQTFNPTFIPVYNPSNGVQTFKLIQQGLSEYTLISPPTVPMSDAFNCVLSASIDNTGNFILYNPYSIVGINFENGQYIGVNYIADCTNLATVNINAASTLTNFATGTNITVSGNAPATLNTNILGLYVNAGNYEVWETNYPPHCYTYKINLLDSTGTIDQDNNRLNFYPRLSANTILNTATLSAYIGSDYNLINYAFDNTMTDYIAYQITSTSLSSINTFLSNVTCTDGNGNIYTLTDSHQTTPPQFIKATQGKDLTIIYNGVNFVNVSFTIKAIVKSAAGILEQYEPLNVTMGLPNALNGNHLFLNVLNEQSNSIVIDSSFNVSASSWPSRDLTNSQITWDWYDGTLGNKDLPLALNYVDSEGNYIAPVNGSTTFNSNTWTVELSGYGSNQITVSLYSDKYNETATVKTNQSLYNFLENGKLIITPLSELNNLNLTRTIQLKVQVPFEDRLFDIPASIPIYWTWEYDNVSNSDLLPITAEQILNNNLNYDYGVNSKASTLSAIQINVTPGYARFNPVVHKVTVNVYTDVVSPPVSGSYTFFVDDFPDPSIFNADFATYYSAFTSSTDFQIANTRNNDTTITRPNGYDLNCTFIAYNDVIPNIKGGSVNWLFNNNTIQNNTNTYTLDLNDPNLNLPTSLSYGYQITSANIGFEINSAIAPGWTSAHSVKSSNYFYILNSIDFYNPLNFIIYPEYAWLEPDSTHVTLLSTDPTLPSYYTNSYRPSAYGNKKSNSQTFWLSANKKCFNEYIYQNMETYDIFQTESNYDLLDIKYNQYDISASVGIPISLNGYNDTFYPENLKIPYWISKSINGINLLTTEYYTITSQTINFTEPTNNLANNFFLSPIILPYNYISLNFVPNQTDINLDNNSNISITQKLNTYPLNQPAVITGGTVTYYLSSHFWTVSSTVPAIDGTYSLFDLQIGDPAIPLNSGDLGKDYFYLYAKTNIIQNIPSTTFDNYSIAQYSKDRNLWSAINI